MKGKVYLRAYTGGCKVADALEIKSLTAAIDQVRALKRILKAQKPAVNRLWEVFDRDGNLLYTTHLN